MVNLMDIVYNGNIFQSNSYFMEVWLYVTKFPWNPLYGSLFVSIFVPNPPTDVATEPFVQDEYVQRQRIAQIAALLSQIRPAA